MKRKNLTVGSLSIILVLFCGISFASKLSRRKMPRSSEEAEPPDHGAVEKEAYMRQLQHEIEMRQQNPFLCLPKYLCIVQGESGQMKTAVLSSLRPIPPEILKIQQNSGPFPFPDQGLHRPRPRPTNTPKPTKSSSTSDESKENDNGSNSPEDELDYSGSTEDLGRTDILLTIAKDQDNQNHNDTGPVETKKKGVMGKLKTFLMPSFKMPTLPLIPMPGLPSLSLFKGSKDKEVDPSHSPPQNNGNLLKRRTSFFSRVKRQADTEDSEEEKQSQEEGQQQHPDNHTHFRTPEQCQLLFSGCQLSYDEIMNIAGSGAVMIENDDPAPPAAHNDPGYARPPKRRRPIKIEDDELDQFLREQAQKKINERRKKPKKPTAINYYSNYHPSTPNYNIPNGLVVHQLSPGQATQLLYPKRPSGQKKPGPVKLQQFQHAQEFLTQDSKYGSSSSFYNQNKPLKHVKPLQYDEDDVDTRNPSSSGLPILPVRFQWGRPVQVGNKYIRPFQKNPHFQQASPAPFYTTTTEPPPIFSKTPVDNKPRPSIPIFANRTHQAILKQKPYHPFHVTRTKQFDKFGRPVSYASVFTEVAGSSGGVHDYFDKIASTIGENIIKTEQDLLNSNKKKKRVSRRKKNRVTSQASKKPVDSDEDKDESTKEEDDPEDNTKEDDRDNEKDAEDVDEEEEDADEEDDTEISHSDHKKKKNNKYNEEKEILAVLPTFMQEAIHNDRIRRKNKKKKKTHRRRDERRTDRRRGEPVEEIEYEPIEIRPPSKQQRPGFFSSIYNMMSPKRKTNSNSNNSNTNKWSPY